MNTDTRTLSEQLEEESEQRKTVGLLEQVRAIETLEYHDANRLSGTSKSRSELKRFMLTQAIEALGGGTEEDR
jgi:ABC-type phosphate/phosphonate transport system ATPase subunit